MDGQNNENNHLNQEPPSPNGAANMSRSQLSQTKKKPKRTGLKIVLGLLFVGCVTFLLGTAMVVKIAKEAPELSFKKLGDSLMLRFYDISSNLIYETGEKKRELVSIEEVPLEMKQAVISIEDKRFEEHIGVDPIRIAGAALSNFKNDTRQGGSTLTQQLIKLSFFSTDIKDQNYVRKIQEAWLAIQLEQQKSKDEILNYYINKVYMGNGFYGMETAATGYYGKSLEELSLAQQALMAGIPQSPRDYDPVAFPEQATERRNLVLREMRNDKNISTKEYDDAVAEDITEGLITTQKLTKQAKIIDNYIKEAIAELQTKTNRDIYTEGMDVYTNLDLDAQKYVYHVVNSDEYLDFTDYNDDDLQENFQAAITIIDPQNGQVKAQLGGRKVPDDVQLGENLAVSAARDFGSTVKPITDYAPAIEYLNYSTGRLVLDAPYKYPGTTIDLFNYDKQYRGNITLREALVDSRNIPAVKTLEEVGLDKSQQFLKGLGINYENDLVHSNAIMGDPSSLEMAAAYAAFANGGIYYEPYYINKIVFSDGQEETFQPEGKRAMKESTAYMVTDMLKDVMTRGTGFSAQVPGLIEAGKTGTSNYTDADKGKLLLDIYGGVPDISFVGFTPHYVVSIWTGYSKYLLPINIPDQENARLLYKYIMGYISQNLEVTDWEMPEDVVKIGSELYVKNHTTDQNTWSPPPSSSSSYSEVETQPSSSSSIEQPPPASSSSTTPLPPASSSTPPPEPEPEPEPSTEPPETPGPVDPEDEPGAGET